MTNRQLARIHVALRIRARLRQEDVASAAGISRRRVVDLEAGRIALLRVGELEASFAALGARITITAGYRGAALDRLLDELHAALLAAVLRLLAAFGWETQIEVTYSVGAERGSIDILAWKPADRALLVGEVKSELPGVDPLLRPLDAKTRLAPLIARQRYGWDALTVSRLVILPDERTARRMIARQRDVFHRALPARSRDVRRWLREPRGTLSGLWFLSLGRPADTTRNPSAIRRVQRPRSRAGHACVSVDPAEVRLIDPHNVRWEHN